METNQTPYTQAVEDIATFLNTRHTIASEFNKESEALRSKLEIEVLNHKEILLFSVPFADVAVTFGTQQMENLFHRYAYPKGGLFLKEVRFIHMEGIFHEDLTYLTDIRVQFLFNEKGFNHDIALRSLAFDDEFWRVSEQVVGLGRNPRFISQEKYEEVKNTLQEIARKIRAEKTESLSA